MGKEVFLPLPTEIAPFVNHLQTIQTEEVKVRLASDQGFLNSIFTPQEGEYLGRRLSGELAVQEIASRYAAKMGVAGILWPEVDPLEREVPWQAIEIRNLPTGKPTVELSGQALETAKKQGRGEIAVSIAHLQDVAGAFVVASDGSRQGVTCGLDLIEIQRVARVWKKYPWDFLNRVITPEEQKEMSMLSVSDMAGHFAAKEAVAKLLGTGLQIVGSRTRQGVSWKEIMYFNSWAAPQIKLCGKARAAAERQGIGFITVKIEHKNGLLTAFALAFKNPK